MNLLQAASTNEVSQSEIICRLRNQHTLVASGLVESGSDEDVLNFVNKSLLPALPISPNIFAVFVHHLGKPRQDGSPRLCKLYFNSAVACDAVLSQMRKFPDKSKSIFAGVHFRPSLTCSQLDRKQILEQYHWNSFPKDSTGRLPVVMHYEPDGSPYLWHFLHKCRINLPSSTPSTSVSLESVPISTDKAAMNSGSDEVSHAELAEQTENDASLMLPSVSVLLDPKVASVDWGVQTVDISAQAIQLFHRQECARFDQGVQTDQSALDQSFVPSDTLFGAAGSQSDISECGPWMDDDCDEDQWQDYDSDSYADKKERFEQEEIAFQKHALALKSRMQPLTEEERLLDSRDLPLHPVVATGGDQLISVVSKEVAVSDEKVVDATAIVADHNAHLLALEAHAKSTI